MHYVPQSALTDPMGSGAVKVSAQLRGDTISYALQHIAHNVVANFYEPALDSYLQRKYYEQHKNGEHGSGSYNQNLVGQLVGDFAGGGALIAAELLIPNQLHTFTRAARRAIDPVYECFAHWALADQKQAADYTQQVERWKTYQERSIVRSAIMVTGSMAANIATQKAIGNPSPAKVIFGTRIISTALTAVLGLASRVMFPEHTRKFDDWINSNVVQPLITDAPAEAPTTYADKLRQKTSGGSTVALR